MQIWKLKLVRDAYDYAFENLNRELWIVMKDIIVLLLYNCVCKKIVFEIYLKNGISNVQKEAKNISYLSNAHSI